MWDSVAFSVRHASTSSSAASRNTITTLTQKLVIHEGRGHQPRSRFLSILADGSTDTGIIEQELVHVRYVRDNGDVATYMIKLQPVKSANAAGILEAFDEAANTMGIREDTWKEKVVCATVDGTAVMMEKTGVAGRLKQRIPHIITIHCVAHKLELAVLDSVKEAGTFQWAEEHTVAPSRRRCLKAVEKNYTPTVVHMENMAEGSDVKAEDAAEAKGVVQEMKTEKFVRFLRFMLDSSTILSKCCTDFQHDNLNITRTNQLVESTTSRLLSLKTKPGEYQKSLDTKFTANQDGSICYCGTQLTKSQPLLAEVRAQAEAPLVQRSRRLLTTQSSTWTTDLKICVEKPLSSFKVFDPSTLPYPREELANYGDEEVDYLVTHFACLLDEKEKIPQEWMDLKVWLPSVSTVLTDVMALGHELFHTFSVLFFLAIVLVEVDVGFICPKNAFPELCWLFRCALFCFAFFSFFFFCKLQSRFFVLETYERPAPCSKLSVFTFM
uniref:DUF4371 domain-containing protein n=1 Tax=Maylandia zebra TaxID=106582 RepID=A0A3P9DGY3_9CICH